MSLFDFFNISGSKSSFAKGGKVEGYEKFKEGATVKVDEAYLKDEASGGEATATAIVLSEPSDAEELVQIQYENGNIDYLGQEWLEVIDDKEKFYKGGDAKPEKVEVEVKGLVEVVDILNGWEKYAKAHGEDEDDIDDFNKYLNKEHGSLGHKMKEKAIREFAKVHPELVEDFAKGGSAKSGITISYQKHWGKDGTVYDQTIKIDRATFEKLKDAVHSEIALNRPRKDEYVSTSGYEFFLKPLVSENGVCHLNHTQTRFINLFLKLKLKDRNTMLKIVEKYEDGGDVDGFAKGGGLGKQQYVEWSSWFDTHPYDIEKIKSIIEKAGGKEIHTENDRGWSNQPEVVVFKGDKEVIEKALQEGLGTEWIIISDKDWRTKKA